MGCPDWLDLLTPQGDGPFVRTLYIHPRGKGPYHRPFFFFSPDTTELLGDFYCMFNCIRILLCFQLALHGSLSMCRWIFGVFVGEGEIRILLPCHLDPTPSI